MSQKLGIILFGLALFCSQPAGANDLGQICPDRPGKGTSPCTVPTGHAQVEVGLFDESFQRRSGVTTDAGNAGSLLAKYGLTDRLDIEAGMALYQFQRTHSATQDVTIHDVGDLFLHAKYNPLTADGAFAFVLDPFLKLPTAGRLGNGAVEGGLVAPMAYDLGNNWSLAMTPEADILQNASGTGNHANLVNVVGLGRSFGSLTLGAEVWTAQNFDPAGTVSQYSLDMTAAWIRDNDTQLDFGANLGLNRQTPDLEIYAGISRRF
jgi:hypothetical protein